MKYYTLLRNMGCIMLLMVSFASCKKFLDEKPDQKLAIPATLPDAQALLDYYTIMNGTMPNMGMEADDDFYMTNAYFAAANANLQNNYLWKKDIVTETAWSNLYRNISYCNTALETVEKIPVTSNNNFEWRRVRASALFQRAVYFYFLLQYYATPYDAAIAANMPGIPLRLSSDINTATTRNTIAECYRRITEDMLEAVQYLPEVSVPLSRPSKPAAFGFLARLHHNIEDYAAAAKYADSALQYNSTLLNYNTISQSATAPFPQFNAEVVYPLVMSMLTRFNSNNLAADSSLFAEYNINDLRRTLFFKSLSVPNTYGFRGNYEGNINGILFTGIAVDELYLIKAEAAAWGNEVATAMQWLNALLVTRYRTNTYVPLTAANKDEALNKILKERRKELLGRGLRWPDLRRLNKFPQYAKILRRNVNGNITELLPLSKNYTFYIPQVVIDLSGIEQNVRE